jgi:hypothetical protein
VRRALHSLTEAWVEKGGFANVLAAISVCKERQTAIHGLEVSRARKATLLEQVHILGILFG